VRDAFSILCTCAIPGLRECVPGGWNFNFGGTRWMLVAVVLVFYFLFISGFRSGIRRALERSRRQLA
jgi:hypothetical protein